MAEIRITGFDGIERMLVEVRDTAAMILQVQKKQPERESLLACINAMQAAVESLILAHEELAGGQTPASIDARHAMNAAQMLKHLNGEVPWFEWVFPEEQDGQMFEKATRGQPFAKATRLVKKTAPAKKGKRK
jgi:hypothetical protein